MLCPNCGYDNTQTNRFCARCGVDVSAPPAPETPSFSAGASAPPAPAGAQPPPPPAAPSPWGAPPPPPPGQWSAPAPGPLAPAPEPPGSAPPNPFAPPAPYGYPGGYPPPYPSPYPPAGPSRPTNGLAVASLILGIVGWVPCGIGSVVGVVLGFVARGQIRAAQGRQGGDGLALAGIILGFVGIGFIVLLLVLGALSGSSSTST